MHTYNPLRNGWRTFNAAGLEGKPLEMPDEKPRVTLRQRALNFFTGGGKFNREKLAALGLGCLLSYGFISNINVGILTSIAWATFSKQTGMSPLEAGQWPKFVAIQVGLYAVFGNLLRPARLALAVSVAPIFDRIIGVIQRRLQASRAVGIFVTVFLFNFVINILFMCSGIYLASQIVGVPAIPQGHTLDVFSRFAVNKAAA
eukprot:CAMPEP_0114516496 /NCGR_PEP_ID=MMETSP0109-20121206/17360_1 /TAXON_ID=29199 /ORGANISM="Chlorarachnion reptans, Strain CCCM449" /LENGTH=201 /DNA_ID=CAMNT_0001696891 /DNA_START=275 /DNA_END=880 /DNA_ORIENTATION=+